jgi:NAD(P)-dependent dehydrogenase (short-subunit alcohol dehydrogenase family)
MKNVFSIKNKIILITGAGRGIGHHLAKEMANSEAIVYCIDKQFPTKIPKHLTKNLFQIEADVTDDANFYEICKKIFSKHKKIDVLVNNAGISYAVQKKSEMYPIEKWHDTIKVNLTAAFTCSQNVIKFMKKRKSGAIINITSINAKVGFPRNPSYVASKGGLKMLGKALAKDWGPLGIRVNNLGPGYIRTDMTMKRYLNKKTRKQREERTMLGRWGEIDDLVGPCIFLASDASRYITGIDLYVDGGWTANGLSE